MRTPVDVRRLSRTGQCLMALCAGMLSSVALAVPGTVDLLATPPEITASVAPNVALTFDDSGSMDWEYMPDNRPYYGGSWGLSTSITSDATRPWFCAGRIDARVTDASDPRSKPMNGMYYDPNVTYRPPLKADGVTEFPAAVFTAAWNEGVDFNRPVAPNVAGGVRNLRTTNFCRTAQPLADPTYHQLEVNEFNQDWENPGLITVDNNWTQVPSLYGFASDIAGSLLNVDPNSATMLAYNTGTSHVFANQSSGTTTTGGIHEMSSGSQIAGNLTIGLLGDATRDAPHLLLRLNTVRCTNVQVSYRLRDLNNVSTAAQQIGVHARIGNAGAWTAVGYHANANTGSGFGPDTLGNVTLPLLFNGNATVQLRWLTTNASGNDNMIGIDNVKVTGTCIPTTVDENAGYYRFKDTVPLTQDAFGRITTPQATLYNAANWEWVPLPITQRQNFANWYSYYRDRNSSAITSMSRAFAPFDENIRVVWQNLGLNTATAGVDAPVLQRNTTPMYKFADDASNSNVRTRFYNWLFQIPAAGNTPNVAASNRVGQYFTGGAGVSNDTNPYWDRDLNRELSCRQNFQINMSDGFWNNTNPAPTNINSQGLRYVDSGVTLPDGRVYNTGDQETKLWNRFTGTPLEPTMTDSQFHYWASDLRPDFAAAASTRLKVPPFIPDRSTALFGIPIAPGQDARNNKEVFWNPANDPATWPHLVNFNISFGLDGTIPQTAEVYEKLRLGNDASFIWPYPGGVSVDDGRKLDDFWHAALVSRGRFLSAKNPEELISALQEVIASIIARRGASTAVSVSLPIITDGTTGYTAGYDTTDWSGFFTRNELDPLTAQRIGVLWDAGCILTGGACSSTAQTGLPVRDPNSRLLVTSSGTPGSGAPFRWTNLTALQKARFNVDPASIRLDLGTWTPDPHGDLRVDYLRGVRTNENTAIPRFRARSSVLGAVIRGQPVYVSSPTAGHPDTFPTGSPEQVAAVAGQSYAAFQVANRNRAPTVYVAANDGMLHAFNGSNGTERWAYVPNVVIENFRLTRSTRFESGFTPSVDDKPQVTDVFMNGNWKSVLLGSMRLGGRGIYMLDITNVPAGSSTEAALATSIPKWEFSNVAPAGNTTPDCAVGARHCSSLGYTYDSINVARIKYQNKWVALVSSGYFPIDGLDPASNSPKANQTSLLVIDLATGQLVREIVTNTAPQTATQSYGLSQPIVMDTGSDSVDDIAIAGDLAGNLWRFDLSGATPADWKVDLMFTTYGAGGGSTAGAAGAVGERPISSAPIIMRDATGREPIVVFGSGKFIGLPDRSAAIPQQSFYGVEDYGTCSVTNTAACNAYPIRPNQLTVQKITQASNAVRTIDLSTETAPTAAQNRGWRIRLDVPSEPGERSFDTPFPFYTSNQVLLRSIIPKGVDPCDPGARYGLMVVNASDGGPDIDLSVASPARTVGGVVGSAAPPGDPVTLRGGGDIVIPGLGDDGAAGGTPGVSAAVLAAIKDRLSEADDIWHRGAWRDVQPQ